MNTSHTIDLEAAPTKQCRECKMEIPAGAHTCPYCRKDQVTLRNGIIAWVAIIITALLTWKFWDVLNDFWDTVARMVAR